ncbi:MAG: PilZ domain-containing protein [Candidatus Brocadiia bacterium]
MLANSTEHRNYERYRVKDGVVKYKKYHFLGLFDKLSARHLILDISPQGVQFVTREEFKEGAKLALDISVPSLDQEIIHARGLVIWVRKAPGLMAYGVGVKFVSMKQSDQDKLKLLLENNAANKVKISDSAFLKKINKL